MKAYSEMTVPQLQSQIDGLQLKIREKCDLEYKQIALIEEVIREKLTVEDERYVDLKGWSAMLAAFKHEKRAMDLEDLFNVLLKGGYKRRNTRGKDNVRDNLRRYSDPKEGYLRLTKHADDTFSLKPEKLWAK